MRKAERDEIGWVLFRLVRDGGRLSDHLRRAAIRCPLTYGTSAYADVYVFPFIAQGCEEVWFWPDEVKRFFSEPPDESSEGR